MSNTKIKVMNSREDWLKERKGRIGGSEAAAVLGISPHMSNLDLWQIKTGRKKKQDISDNPLVRYGNQAEPLIRDLFRIDHEDLNVEYIPNNLWTNDRFPFAHASLDGWFTDREGCQGILEIKTATLTSRVQREEWQGKIPDHYYCQVLHYLMVTEFDYAILVAQLKDEYGDRKKVINEYTIRRDDEGVEETIAYLAEQEKAFWERIRTDSPPNLIIPGI